MKMKRIMSIFLVVVLASCLVSCSSDELKELKRDIVIQPSKKDSYYPITIQTYGFDKELRRITIEEEPKRVVAVYQNSIETMLALGLEDKIVLAAGLDHPIKDDYVYQFETLDYHNELGSKDKVLDVNPDLILGWQSLFSEEKLGEVDYWLDSGINTYIAQNSGIKYPESLENEFQDIINIGRIFNVEERADRLIRNMKQNMVRSRSLAGTDHIDTLIIEDLEDGNFLAYGKDTIGGNIATQVGADLMVVESKNLSKSEVLGLNPQVIFTVYYGNAIERTKAYDRIKNDEVLAGVEAVKNNRIVPIMLSEVYVSGIRTLDGIDSIIKGLYPEKID